MRFLLVTLALVTTDARADECAVTEVEYTLSSKLEFHVPMGHGNETVTIGPGKTTLRFEGNRVTMLSYEMHETFTIRGRVGPFSSSITTDADLHTPKACVLMEGTLEGNVVRWRGPVRGIHTDGTLTCSGICGKFGLPPHGRSPFHVGAADQTFNAFVFDREMKSFTMAKVTGARPDTSTMETAFTLEGRESRRSCGRTGCS